MRVVFSDDVFGLQSRGGISRYVVELHKEFLRLGVRSTIAAGLHVSDALDGIASVRGRRLPRPLPQRVHRAVSAVAASVLDAHSAFGKAEVYHMTYYPTRPVRRGAVLAVTVYDMIHEMFPGDFPTSDRTTEHKRAACRAADVIFAISASTRHDLLNRFDIAPDKVVVTRLGVPDLGVPGAVTSPRSRPYLLYVGARRASYKNFLPLARALRHVGVLRDFDLVCFGGGTLTIQEAAELQTLGIAGAVHVAQGDDVTLARYYRHATAYICPSLYEGFGLPALEAMSLGCAVACSHTSSLPEVCGAAATYFDPHDLNDLGNVVCKLVSDKSFRLRLAAEGERRARGFSWTATAMRTLEGYRLAGAQ